MATPAGYVIRHHAGQAFLAVGSTESEAWGAFIQQSRARGHAIVDDRADPIIKGNPNEDVRLSDYRAYAATAGIIDAVRSGQPPQTYAMENGRDSSVFCLPSEPRAAQTTRWIYGDED